MSVQPSSVSASLTALFTSSSKPNSTCSFRLGVFLFISATEAIAAAAQARFAVMVAWLTLICSSRLCRGMHAIVNLASFTHLRD